MWCPTHPNQSVFLALCGYCVGAWQGVLHSLPTHHQLDNGGRGRRIRRTWDELFLESGERKNGSSNNNNFEDLPFGVIALAAVMLRVENIEEDEERRIGGWRIFTRCRWRLTTYRWQQHQQQRGILGDMIMEDERIPISTRRELRN